ncbi:MAG: hypothetical protein GPJ54_05675 [Candidatus Heimdallarchaeota archaeon]|nr:hypothetical protein [Candidatus Heimdallarchaeota archaeon]
MVLQSASSLKSASLSSGVSPLFIMIKVAPFFFAILGYPAAGFTTNDDPKTMKTSLCLLSEWENKDSLSGII